MKQYFPLSIFCVLIILMAIMVPGCQSSPDTTAEITSTAQPEASYQPTMSVKNYTNATYGFSMQYPESWEFEEDIINLVALFTTMEGPTEYMVNINIATEELPNDISAKDYAKLGELHLKNTHDTYENLNEETITISEYPAIIRTFSVTMQGISIKDTQIYIVKDNTAYIITYDSNLENYEQYKDVLTLVINTFKFE